MHILYIYYTYAIHILYIYYTYTIHIHIILPCARALMVTKCAFICCSLGTGTFDDIPSLCNIHHLFFIFPTVRCPWSNSSLINVFWSALKPRTTTVVPMRSTQPSCSPDSSNDHIPVNLSLQTLDLTLHSFLRHL